MNCQAPSPSDSNQLLLKQTGENAHAYHPPGWWPLYKKEGKYLVKTGNIRMEMEVLIIVIFSIKIHILPKMHTVQQLFSS